MRVHPAFLKSLFTFWLLVLSAVVFAQPGVVTDLSVAPTPVTVSGNVNGVSTSATSDLIQVRFSLANCGNANPQVPGYATIVPTTKTFTANASGYFTGTLYGNDQISCNLGFTTVYSISFLRNNVPVGVTRQYRVLSPGPWSLSTAQPVATLPPPNVAASGYTCPAGTFQAGMTSLWTPICILALGGGGGTLSLTTVGTTGPSTLANGVLNIPQYSGASFTSLTAGTNTTAAMLVGTGASLGTTGTGTINATAINGVNVTGTAAAGFVPVATGSGSATFRQLTADDIAPGFSITGFSCASCGTYELGSTIPAPTNLSVSYSSAPGSAIASDGTHSVTLASPFNTASFPYSYACTSGITFTVSATAAVSRSASGSISCAPRTFGGVGTAGANGTTAAGLNAALVGATGTLANAGLGNQSTYGPYTPSNQKIYVVMVGCGHTFKSSGFAFPMLTAVAFTFTNQFGSSIAMCRYESANLLSVPFTLVVEN